MMDPSVPIYLSALMIGLLGSVHCLAMCGGIAGALGHAIPKTTPLSDALWTALYSLGRIASYAIAGGLVGMLGEAFARQTGLAVGLRVLAGLMILGFGLYVAVGWTGFSRLEHMGRAVWLRLAPLTRRIGKPDRAWKILSLGMIWGWLPCGLVYSALVAAAATGRADAGAAFMLCFGLGTLPAVVSASALANRLSGFVGDRFTRRAAGVVLFCFGLWAIASSLMPLIQHEVGGSAEGMRHHSATPKLEELDPESASSVMRVALFGAVAVEEEDPASCWDLH